MPGEIRPHQRASSTKIIIPHSQHAADVLLLQSLLCSHVRQQDLKGQGPASREALRGAFLPTLHPAHAPTGPRTHPPIPACAPSIISWRGGGGRGGVSRGRVSAAPRCNRLITTATATTTTTAAATAAASIAGRGRGPGAAAASRCGRQGCGPRSGRGRGGAGARARGSRRQRVRGVAAAQAAAVDARRRGAALQEPALTTTVIRPRRAQALLPQLRLRGPWPLRGRPPRAAAARLRQWRARARVCGPCVAAGAGGRRPTGTRRGRRQKAATGVSVR